MSLGNPLEFSKTFQLQRMVPKSDRGRSGRWDSFPRVLVVSLQCGSHLVTAYLWKMGRRPGACLAGLGPAWQTGSSRRKPSHGLPSIQGLYQVALTEITLAYSATGLKRLGGKGWPASLTCFGDLMTTGGQWTNLHFSLNGWWLCVWVALSRKGQ